MTKFFRVMPIMAWTRGQIQHERAYRNHRQFPSNFRENSARFPSFFSCLVSCLGIIRMILNLSRNPSKIDLGRGSGPPKSTQDRLWDPLGMPRGSQERSGSAWGASRGTPGASRERPKSLQRHLGTSERAPRSTCESAGVIRINAKSYPGLEKSCFSPAARARSNS